MTEISEFVVLSLGSNVGNRAEYIREAIEHIKTFVQISHVAPLYVSRALLHTDQSDFLNTVVTGTTELEPMELLDRIQQTEREVGRIYRFRYGPREIDIDIAFYGSVIFDSERLTIPHIGAASRDFVLQPLADIAPDFIHPSLDRSISDLLAEIRPEDHSVIGHYDE